MNLVVGKNSKLIKLLKLNPKIVKCVSHAELLEDNFHLAEFDKIFIFSYGSKSKEIFKKVKKYNSYYISSTAVFAYLYYKEKLPSYPKKKYLDEIECLKNGIKILRLGIIKSKTNTPNKLPLTSLEDLKEYVEKTQSEIYSRSQIINLFQITEGSSYKQQLPQLISSLNIPYWITVLFGKILNIDYGYTYHSNKILTAETVQIGHGVIGGSIWKRSRKDLLIVSNIEDEILTTNGFNKTILGFNKNGLAKYWHGVSISTNNQGLQKKIVPFIVKRFSIPKNSIKKHVQNITLINNNFKVEFKNCHLSLTARKLYLASGPISNTKFISSILKNQKLITLSDHEIGFIGEITEKEGQENNLIKSSFIFVIRKYCLTKQINGTQVLLDARPFSGESYDNQFYVDNSLSILKKLVLKFSLKKINEAFFNKFGFAIRTKKISIFAQIAVSDSITFDPVNNTLKRKRLSKDSIRIISKGVGSIFTTFQERNITDFSDGQHIVGGKALVEKASQIPNLKIYGSPTSVKLDSTHHTQKFIK